jgi:hypothetical protein
MSGYLNENLLLPDAWRKIVLSDPLLHGEDDFAELVAGFEVAVGFGAGG